VAQERAVNPKNFFGELKRRNIYKVAIAYAMVAWLLIQIATLSINTKINFVAAAVLFGVGAW
jgi:hypothetical protein